eukprot:jgi/Psemu1/10371/gm1.10371_g
MIAFLAITALISPGVSAFVPSSSRTCNRWISHEPRPTHIHLSDASLTAEHTWTPEDLTSDNSGFRTIPDDDYIKKYQEHPELWPVEFFVVPYRRRRSARTNVDNDDPGAGAGAETQILVRKSSNGTSRYGLGTGVPATRWMISTAQVPSGYELTDPTIAVEASDFPEFPSSGDAPTPSWTYRKIRLRKDAFGRDTSDAANLHDPELQYYAKRVRDQLLTHVSETVREGTPGDGVANQWEAHRMSVVRKILEGDNSVAAIQGALRMSGLFERRGNDGRYTSFSDAPDPVELARSVKVYTMFPQMPDPMPLPSTPPEALKEEIRSRPSRMVEAGRDPHRDRYGRTYTHISTSNVSNTIHGVYLTFDATDCLPDLGDGKEELVPPALDLFGTNHIQKEWRSLQDLKVLDADSDVISREDPKPTFISGFIARQLVKDGVIDIYSMHSSCVSIVFRPSSHRPRERERERNPHTLAWKPSADPRTSKVDATKTWLYTSSIATSEHGYRNPIPVELCGTQKEHVMVGFQLSLVFQPSGLRRCLDLRFKSWRHVER